MVAPEDAYDVLQIAPEARSLSRSAELQWQPARGLLVQGTRVSRSDWMSLLLGLLGRRAPARRPALTAEA